MASDSTNLKQDFFQYVLNNLSVADFNNLPDLLGWYKRKVTMRLQSPRTMEVEMIKKLIEILNNDLALRPIELIDQFELGYDTMNVDEYRAFLIQ